MDITTKIKRPMRTDIPDVIKINQRMGVASSMSNVVRAIYEQVDQPIRRFANERKEVNRRLNS